MWDRLLLAIDHSESGQSALGFTAGLAAATGAEVRVLHVRELPIAARVPPLETPVDADGLVDEAVLTLRIAGVGSEGCSCSVSEKRVAQRIVEESLYWMCDAIVLGSRRLHGMSRLSGQGTRERVLRMSPLPVIVAPTPTPDGLSFPGLFSRADVGPDGRGR